MAEFFSQFWLFVVRQILKVDALFVTLIDEVGELFAWLLVLNALTSLALTVWFARRARHEDRSRPFWMLYGPLWGMVAGFFTPMLAMVVKGRCESRGENGNLWFVLVSLLSVFAYYARRILVDAKDRHLSSVPGIILSILGGLLFVSTVTLPFVLLANREWVGEVWDAGGWWQGLFLAVTTLLFVGLLIFEFTYRRLRPRLTLAHVKQRLAETDDLHETGDDLVVVENLVKYYPVRRGFFGTAGVHVKAVDGVSFRIRRGATLGLVGESGCGKTTIGRLLLRLLEPTGGRVLFEGMDLQKLLPTELRTVRAFMQLVFQDPFGSLNPRQTVEAIVGEALTIHGIARGRARREAVAELLSRVGLSPDHLKRYPHEFSGGQRQRIGIARALALNPSLIICDEPVSALDVSIQAQILNLLADLRDELGLTYLFIAHDLSVVEHISDDVAVMYLGKLVEQAPSADLYRNPMHPYTKALLSSIPIPDPSVQRERILLTGDVPTPINPPTGCAFHPRCRYATKECVGVTPGLSELVPNHSVACIRAEEIQNDPVGTITHGIDGNLA